MGKWWRLGLGLGRACWVVFSEDFRLTGCLPEWGSLSSHPGKTLSFRTGSGQRARGSEAGDRSAWEMTLYPVSLICCSLFVQLSPSLSPSRSRLPVSDLVLFIPSHYHALCSPSESSFLHSHDQMQTESELTVKPDKRNALLFALVLSLFFPLHSTAIGGKWGNGFSVRISNCGTRCRWKGAVPW